MVFELTDSLISDEIFTKADYRRSLYNLFLGFEEGNLLLSMSPRLLDFLDDERLDDSLSRRVVNYLQNRAMGHYEVLWQIRIVLKDPDSNNREIALPFFKNTSAIQPPILLCEHLNDTRFYFALCQEFFGVSFINTKNGQGAGGSAVAESLEQIVKGGDRFCLCIVDSDKKCADDIDGGTYKAILNKHLTPQPFYSVYKLNVHEIENLIPFCLIDSFIKEEQPRKFAKRLKLIDNNGDLLKYYDVKDGIKRIAIAKNPRFRSFAETVYNRLKKRSDKKTFDMFLSSIKDKTVFPHLCPGALDRFLEIDTARSGPRFVYCDYLRDEWLSIKDYIVTFLCARSDDPIN